MKFKSLFFAAVAAVFSFASCDEMGKNQDLGAPAITVSATELSFEEAGGNQTVTLNATRDWKVTSTAEWVVVSPASGTASAADQTVEVSVLANEGGSRTANLTFTIGMVSKTVKVSQVGTGVTPPEVGITSIADVLAATGALPANTVIKGIVISNLALNNLTSKKGMYVQDETAGLQFYLGSNHSFAVGTEVKIDLSGVTVGDYNGAVQISGLALDKITQVSTDNALVAKTVTVADFLANKYEGQYIALEGVQVASSDLSKTWVSGGSHTSINMEDSNGNKFVVFSSSYASYGAETVAQGSGTIKGISSINKGTMQIIFAQASDYAGLTGERFDGVVVPPAGDDNTGDDNTGDDNTGDDNTGDTPTPPAGDVTGTSLTISRETISNISSWTTNSYGSQNITSLDTYLSWSISGCNFIGAKLCLTDTKKAYAATTIQGQGNTDSSKQCRLGNTTSLGKIKKITVVTYNESYTPNFNLAIGATQQVGTAVPSGMVPASSMTTTKDQVNGVDRYTSVYIPTTDAGFFAIYKNTSGALYIESLTVEYELN